MNFAKVVLAAESGFMWIRKLLISEVAQRWLDVIPDSISRSLAVFKHHFASCKWVSAEGLNTAMSACPEPSRITLHVLGRHSNNSSIQGLVPHDGAEAVIQKRAIVEREVCVCVCAMRNSIQRELCAAILHARRSALLADGGVGRGQSC